MINLKKYLESLEEVPCSLCGSKDNISLCKKEKYGLPLNTVICKDCGLLYINPRPTKSLYSEFYKDDYRRLVSNGDKLKTGFDKARKFAKREIITLLDKQIKSVDNFLDIGCSSGGVIQAIKDVYGGDAFGVEPNIVVANFAKQKTSANIFIGLFEDYLPPDHFDLILFIRALNHSLNPSQNIIKIRGMLKNKGVFVLVLYDAIINLLNRPFELMAEATHPYMFCEETIESMLINSGFKILCKKVNALNATNLTIRDISSFDFTSMIFIVQKVPVIPEQKIYPDYEVILRRIEANVRFYNKYRHLIDKNLKANILNRIKRRIYKSFNVLRRNK